MGKIIKDIVKVDDYKVKLVMKSKEENIIENIQMNLEQII